MRRWRFDPSSSAPVFLDDGAPAFGRGHFIIPSCVVAARCSPHYVVAEVGHPGGVQHAGELKLGNAGLEAVEQPFT